jgi:hypothetical protein
MDDSGISIESAKDLTIKAVSSISVSAPKISVKADTTLDLGSDSATNVSSSGTTVIKGSIVQIN